MLKRTAELEKDGRGIADLFASMNRINMLKVKDELENRFPAWLRKTQALSAQIASSGIGMDHWQRGKLLKGSGRKARQQMDEMRDKYKDFLGRLNSMLYEIHAGINPSEIRFCPQKGHANKTGEPSTKGVRVET